MDALTTRQTKVLAVVAKTRDEKFRGPTLKEIQRALRLPEGNVQGASDHLAALEKKGYIVRRPGEAYGARLTEKGEAWWRGGE